MPYAEMRVLHVIDGLSGGGAEQSLREMLPALTGGGLRHAVVTLKPVGAAAEDLLGAGVPVFAPPTPLRGRVPRLRHVQAVVRRVGPALLHSTLFEADLAGRLVGTLTSTPVLTSLVNTTYARAAREEVVVSAAKLAVVREVDGLLARHATAAFHAISHSVADDAVAALRIDRAKIRVVPRGRDTARLGVRSEARRRHVRARLDIPGGAPLLVSVAREEPQKGQLHLVDAVALLRRAHPEVRLLIAGRPGRSSVDLDRRIRERGLETAVRRLGARDDVGDLLVAADVFCFPSLYEGLGGAVLEAMALETPVVASSIPALREVLADGRCGLLVAPADPRALADGVAQVLGDPGGASARGRAANERFRAVYRLDAAVAGMRRLYADVLGTSSAVG